MTRSEGVLPRLVLCLLGALACSQAPPELTGHAVLELRAAWPESTWKPPVDETGTRIPGVEYLELETEVELTADQLGRGSVLVFEGLIGQAVVAVNGQTRPAVLGEPGPVEVIVGPYLQAGSNHFLIRLQERPEPSPLLAGTDILGPELAAPYLLLRPAQSLTLATASLQPNGRLNLRAQTQNAPSGSRVSFEAWLDGTRLAEFGSARVIEQEASLFGTTWSGPLWGLENTPEGQLFHLRAQLLDSRGRLLSEASWRTGLRTLELRDNKAFLNDQSIFLVGGRVTDLSLVSLLEVLAPAGLNLVEYHGRFPLRAEFAMADELGIPLVVLPRCDGRIHVDITELRTHTVELSAQAQRMMDSAAHAPSLLVWSTEGRGATPGPEGKGHRTGSVKKRYIVDMRGDTVSRVVAEWDLVTVSLPVDAGMQVGTGARTFASLVAHHVEGDISGSPLWIPELYLSPGETLAPPTRIAETLELALHEGAVGAVLPGIPSPPNQQEFQETLAQLASRLSIPSLNLEGRRAQARIEVQGLRPGQVAWLTLPGGVRTGAIADAEGTADLSAWHQGTAQVEVDGVQTEIELTPGAWIQHLWSGRKTVVSWANIGRP